MCLGRHSTAAQTPSSSHSRIPMEPKPPQGMVNFSQVLVSQLKYGVTISTQAKARALCQGVQSERSIWVSELVGSEEEAGLEAVHPVPAGWARLTCSAWCTGSKPLQLKNQSLIPGVSLTGITQQKTITENRVKAQTRFHSNQKERWGLPNWCPWFAHGCRGDIVTRGNTLPIAPWLEDHTEGEELLPSCLAHLWLPQQHCQHPWHPHTTAGLRHGLAKTEPHCFVHSRGKQWLQLGEV